MPSLTNWQLETGVSRKKLSVPCSVLQTSDVEGAQCKPAPKHIPKDDAPITGTNVRRLIPEDVRRRNDYSLNNSDIFSSTSQVVSFRTRRECNPLTPVYEVASHSMRPHTPPRQLGETCIVTDIPGTTPAPLFKWSQRHTMNITDIDKTASTSSIGRRCPGYGLQTSDINEAHGKRGFYTKRETNPLTPKYRAANPPPSGSQYLSLEGANHPKPLPRAKRAEEADFSLKSYDVGGSQSQPSIPFPKQRRQWRETCGLNDMPFASPSTKHSVMRPTQRSTNPNNPRYAPLDHKERRIQLPSVAD